MDSLIMNSFSRLRLIGLKYLSHSYKQKNYITPRIIPARVKLYSSLSTETEKPDNAEMMITNISQGDVEIENKLRVLMLEIDVMRHDGMKAPLTSYIRKSNWEHLLTLKSKSARYKYLGYMWKNEKADENKKVKKEAARLKRFEHLATLNNEQDTENKPEMEYSLSKNSMLLRVYETSMNRFYNHRLMQTMLFGQKLILDCSYDKDMTHKESSNAGKQLKILFAENRVHPNPFDLYLCNTDPNTNMMKELYKYIPTMYDDNYPLNVTTENYMDLFPKEKLVYLTPHCRNDLVYDPDDTYIIGCMVDKAHSGPLSVARAKENKIRMARLPLDRYLQWCSGSGKSLTINQVCNILLDMNITGDWNYSLRHVPRRKLVDNRNNSSDFSIDIKKQSDRPYNNKSSFGFSSYKKTNYKENSHFKGKIYDADKQGTQSSPFYKERRKTNKFTVKSLSEDY